jgi:hypothetical protein
MFGDNKAIAAVTFEPDSMSLGAIFHIPTHVEGSKTYYKALACKITITRAQQVELVRVLGGICPVTLATEGNA